MALQPPSGATGAISPQVESQDTKLTGKRLSAPLGWLYDPTHPRHQAALARGCQLCGATAGHPCTNPVQPGLPLPGGRLIHHARTRPDLGDT